MSFPDTLLPAVWGAALEIDELVVRYRCKRCYKYLWLSISRLTHQVIGFHIGDRSTKSLQRLWFSLPAGYRRKLVYTDFYEAYKLLSVFSQFVHVLMLEKCQGKVSLLQSWKGCHRHFCGLSERLWK